MTDGITRFLPKYPNISIADDDLINPYDGNFYNTIYRKKEFYDLRLGKTEDFPDQPGILMKHQKIIARYLSSHTPYKGVLLFHEMGTGKTCSAVGAIEQIRADGNFKGAIYVASKVLSDKFLYELLYTCTDGRYIPEDLGKTDETKDRRHRKAVSDYYKLGKGYTYHTFATKLGRMSDKEIIDTYSNHIIVIDEVHNITDTSGKIKKSTNPEVYKNIWKLLHTAEGCKVLLLSGTPMRNKVSEISSVMNLILPRDEQLPTGSKFINDFFKSEGEDLNLITGTGIERLQRAFKGRVSYLRAMTSDVKRVFKGKSIEMDGNENYFKVVESQMSDFQTKVYKEVEEKEDKNDGVHLSLRQASLMVFPDGSYGSSGFKKYVMDKGTKGGHNNIFGKKRKNQKRYSLEPKFKKLLKANTIDEQIDLLSKYSSKYADGIRIIMESIKQDKLIFIYNEFVTGSGIIIFTLILDALGFSKVTGSNPVSRPDKPTYAVLTGNTPNITSLISAFNNDNNVDGSRINVIIGSQTISEGVSLKNVQVEIIQTPWFNYARIDQAIARGYRVGSHRLLQNSYPDKKITLDIYQQVAVPKGDTSSTEMDMYLLSQKKDISIKMIERVIRESAFDCALTYDRNHVTGKDGSRECDYGPCDYKCKGIKPGEYMNSKDLDYSTYQLYYINKVVARLVDEITSLFQISFLFSLEEIRLELERTDEEDFELITALETIISNSVPITNKYGFTSYLQESGNSYFLVDSLSTIGRSTLSYYTKYPCVKEHLSYNSVRSNYYTQQLIPAAIRDVCMSEGDIKIYINRLPLEIQELMLESSISGILTHDRDKTLTEKQQKLANLIVTYFDSNLKKIQDGKIVVSSLLELNGGPLKCLNVTSKKFTWRECTPEQTSLYEQTKVDVRLKMEEYDFYGLINDKNKNFCIRDLRGGVDKKGHQLTSGQMCYSYTHSQLNYIIVFKTKLLSPPPPNGVIMTILSKGVCGPQDVRGNKKQLPKTVTMTWGNHLSGIKKKENKVRKNKLSGKLDKNNKDSLIGFLQTSAGRSRDKTSGRPTYDDRNFKYDSPIFIHLLTLGGGNSGDSKAKKWNTVINSIDKLSIEEMRRLIFYGSMKKEEKCLFLCAWFESTNRMIPSPWCGDTKKPKPKPKKSSKK